VPSAESHSSKRRKYIGLTVGPMGATTARLLCKGLSGGSSWSLNSRSAWSGHKCVTGWWRAP
jgi:hypothetical protein